MALKSSMRLALSLLLIHLLSGWGVFLTALPWLPKTALLLSIVSSFGYYLARDVLLRFPYSWRRLSLASGSVSIVTRDGSCLTGEIAGGTMISPYFIALGIRSTTSRLPVFRVIFPDAVGQKAFRELCVTLRFA